MIIDRYVDLLKIIETKETKEINVTKDFYKWLKHELGIQDNNTFYGIKLIVIEPEKKKKRKNTKEMESV